MNIIPWILCILLLIAVIVLVRNQRHIDQDINQIIDGITRFQHQSERTEISLYDNEWARLQNAVVDLEEQVLLERSKLKTEEIKNSQFIADITQQLKTPIAGLKLYLQMDQMGQMSSHNQQELELVDKMEQLVYELLYLEKIKSDTYVMNYTSESLAELAMKQKAQIAPLFPKCNILINGDSHMRMDSKWLGEALGNIMKNACEHSSEGGTVLVNIEDNKSSTSVEISDQGGGVKPEHLPQLFTRFFKTEHAAKNSTGIGLAIAKAIVERHHGIITAENKEKGLCVTICLPHIDGIQTI